MAVCKGMLFARKTFRQQIALGIISMANTGAHINAEDQWGKANGVVAALDI